MTAAKRKLSYKERRELDALPARIEALEAEQRDLNARIVGSEFYKELRADIDGALERAQALEQELIGAYARWHELDSRR